MSHEIESGSDLYAGDFKRGQLRDHEIGELMDTFGGRGHITAVLNNVNDGKEATVYRCAAAPGTGRTYCAAKVYRTRKFRAFSHDDAYFGGHVIRNSRQARAVAKRTDTGKAVAHAAWIEREWETLVRLHAAGADVPAPIDHSTDAILMEYLGDDAAAALRLIDVKLRPAEAQPLLARVMRNVEILLSCDRVHGDLSAYNTLYLAGHIRVIDLPQAVDARTNPAACDLLFRDVRNVCGYFARYGMNADAGEIAGSLWTRYIRGEL
jgi:RIO kinase 1